MLCCIFTSLALLLALIWMVWDMAGVARARIRRKR
jgi:hypothetical protein